MTIDDADRDPPSALPFPESICHRCAHRRTITTKTSTFLMCLALPTKYPAQPVRECVAFELQPPAD